MGATSPATVTFRRRARPPTVEGAAVGLHPRAVEGLAPRATGVLDLVDRVPAVTRVPVTGPEEEDEGVGDET